MHGQLGNIHFLEHGEIPFIIYHIYLCRFIDRLDGSFVKAGSCSMGIPARLSVADAVTCM
jgi:hypothetical protein